MKVYFKVLSSIIISLIAWSVVIGLTQVVFGLATGKSDPLNFIFALLLVSAFGLVFFGFLGSLIWTIAFLLMKNINVSEIIKHILSGSFSTLVTPLSISLALFSSNDFNKTVDMYSMLVLIIPVVIVSVFVYRKRHIQSNDNKANQHRSMRSLDSFALAPFVHDFAIVA